MLEDENGEEVYNENEYSGEIEELDETVEEVYSENEPSSEAEEEENCEEEEEEEEEEETAVNGEEEEETTVNGEEEEEEEEEETAVNGEENDDSDFDDNEEMTEEESLNYFKNCVKEYLKLNDEIKTLERAIKTRKDKKNNFSESILSFIQQKDISHIKLQGNYKGKLLESKNTTHKTSVSFKTITETIFDHFEDINDAKLLMDKINNQKKEKTATKLRLGNLGRIKKNKLNSRNLNQIINDDTNQENNAEAEVPEHMQYLYTTIQN